MVPLPSSSVKRGLYREFIIVLVFLQTPRKPLTCLLRNLWDFNVSKKKKKTFSNYTQSKRQLGISVFLSLQHLRYRLCNNICPGCTDICCTNNVFLRLNCKKINNPSDPMSLIWDKRTWNLCEAEFSHGEQRPKRTQIKRDGWYRNRCVALRVRRQKMPEEKGRVNFTRRRCWWSKTEKWDREGWETERKGRERKMGTDKGSKQRNIHMRNRQRKSSNGRPLLNHPFTDLKLPNLTGTLNHFNSQKYHRDCAIIKLFWWIRNFPNKNCWHQALSCSEKMCRAAARLLQDSSNSACSNWIKAAINISGQFWKGRLISTNWIMSLLWCVQVCSRCFTSRHRQLESVTNILFKSDLF